MAASATPGTKTKQARAVERVTCHQRGPGAETAMPVVKLARHPQRAPCGTPSGCVAVGHINPGCAAYAATLGLWCRTALRFCRRDRLGELAIMRWVMPLHDPTRKASSGHIYWKHYFIRLNSYLISYFRINRPAASFNVEKLSPQERSMSSESLGSCLRSFSRAAASN